MVYNCQKENCALTRAKLVIGTRQIDFKARQSLFLLDRGLAMLEDYNPTSGCWECRLHDPIYCFRTRSGYRTHLRRKHPELLDRTRIPSHWRYNSLCLTSAELHERRRQRRHEAYLLDKQKRLEAERRLLREEAIDNLRDEFEREHPIPPKPGLNSYETPPVKPRKNIYLKFIQYGIESKYPEVPKRGRGAIKAAITTLKEAIYAKAIEERAKLVEDDDNDVKIILLTQDEVFINELTGLDKRKEGISIKDDYEEAQKYIREMNNYRKATDVYQRYLNEYTAASRAVSERVFTEEEIENEIRNIEMARKSAG